VGIWVFAMLRWMSGAGIHFYKQCKRSHKKDYLLKLEATVTDL